MKPSQVVILVSMFAFASACGAPPAATTTPGAAAVAASPTEGTVASADGVPIHYRVVGQGEPAVVLMHCWGCSTEEWADSVAPLAATRQVVLFDYAGHGASGKDRKAWTMASFVGDLRAVLDHVGVKQAILVGHSMSGGIAVAAAAAMPERVVGVIPVDSLHNVTQPDDPEGAAQIFGAMRADFAKGVEALVRAITPPTIDPAVLQRILAMANANDPAIAVPILEALWSYDLKGEFARVKVPMIAINADLFPTQLEANRTLAPQFDVRIISGVGHWPMFEAPQRFTELLVQTVAEVAAAAK